MKEILLVDDHPVARDGLARSIAEVPGLHVCGKASSASMAMQMAVNLKPDLAIIDISLGGKNGIELLKSLKAVIPEMQALIFSMHDEMLYAERALQAGAMGYITKGEAVEQVIEGVRAILAGEIFLSKTMNDQLIKNSIKRPSGVHSSLKGLSDRQLEILELLGGGRGSREIAKKLKLSVKTVETHRENIKHKLGLANASALLRYAVLWCEQRN